MEYFPDSTREGIDEKRMIIPRPDILDFRRRFSDSLSRQLDGLQVTLVTGFAAVRRRNESGRLSNPDARAMGKCRT